MTFEEAVIKLKLRQPITKRRILAQELLSILKEDVIDAADRPGSWEGSKMLSILEAHGFLND
ncbi:MAG: hypothetical protein KJ737_03515 [Proteobacteria bacterium]|nr:hypothetical protein [Pseudomonadota bacterium]